MWLDRNQIKQRYQLSERSFFRWIDKLHHYGLKRWLPAQGKPLLRLYYRSDLELAVEKLQADDAAASHPGRPRKGLVAVSQQPAEASASAQVISSPPAEILTPAPATADLAAFAPTTSREISHLAAALRQVQGKCSGLEQTVQQLQQRCDSLAAQLQHQAQTQQQTDTKDEILAAIDKLARKLLRRSTAPAPSAIDQNRAARKPRRARTAARAKTVKPATRSKTKAVTSKLKAKTRLKKAGKKKPAKRSC
jgi:hypothetical protein